MAKTGLQAEFIDGFRVTDAASIRLIDRTLAREISPGIARKILALGGRAAVLPGKKVLRAKKMAYRRAADRKAVDLGFVGEITRVDAAPIRRLVKREVTPVISPLALRREGGGLQHQTPTSPRARWRRRSRPASSSTSPTSTGVLASPDDPSSTIPSLTPREVASFKKKGVITGGMIPKVDSAVDALKNGVGQVHFLDGRIPHSLLLEIFTDAGIGTEFHK